jgi:hypothetical protein
MPVVEASSQETPYGRMITSGGWFVLNLADALAVRNGSLPHVRPMPRSRGREYAPANVRFR